MVANNVRFRRPLRRLAGGAVPLERLFGRSIDVQVTASMTALSAVSRGSTFWRRTSPLAILPV